MLRRALSIPVLFTLALYLTPVASAHFCYWFSSGEHHGDCEHHAVPPTGAYKTPHDNDCFDFEKDGTRTLTNDPVLSVKQPDTPVPAIIFQEREGWDLTEVELRLPVRSDTTDPPDQTSDPTRGPPFFMA